MPDTPPVRTVRVVVVVRPDDDDVRDRIMDAVGGYVTLRAADVTDAVETVRVYAATDLGDDDLSLEIDVRVPSPLTAAVLAGTPLTAEPVG